MKKLFTLITLFAMTMAANAQRECCQWRNY